MLEQTFILERKMEIMEKQKSKKKDKMNNKQLANMLQKCAKRKYASD